jgi:hypothetical protein
VVNKKKIIRDSHLIIWFRNNPEFKKLTLTKNQKLETIRTCWSSIILSGDNCIENINLIFNFLGEQGCIPIIALVVMELSRFL